MPEYNPSQNSIKLIVIDGGRVDFIYFSKKELEEYKCEDNIQRVFKKIENKKKINNELEGIVKEVLKKIFFNKDKNKKETLEVLEEKPQKQLKQNEIEKIEKKLNDYIREKSKNKKSDKKRVFGKNKKPKS